MADSSETAKLLLQSFLDKVTGPLQRLAIELVTDQKLNPETNNSFSCSVLLNQGQKKLPPEKIYVSFSSFPMIKFFGRTWTEFQGEQGIATFLTGIEDQFRHIKA